MSYQQFQVSLVNPNDNHGGGGCVCDPRKQEDCKPPYIVIQDNEMLDHLSPRVVICAACAEKFAEACNGEALEMGERVAPPALASSDGSHLKAQKESPEFEDSELLRELKAPAATDE